MEEIKTRRSVRKFKDTIIEDQVLNELVERSRFSPSWGNTQCTRYHFIKNIDIIKRIKNEAVMDFVYNKKVLENAKQILILTYVTGKSGKLEKYNIESSNPNKWEIFDVGIACQTFCLAAWEKKIGTVIMGVIDDQKIKEIINLNDNENVAALIVYGIPEEIPQAPKRLEVNELINIIK